MVDGSLKQGRAMAASSMVGANSSVEEPAMTVGDGNLTDLRSQDLQGVGVVLAGRERGEARAAGWCCVGSSTGTDTGWVKGRRRDPGNMAGDGGDAIPIEGRWRRHDRGERRWWRRDPGRRMVAAVRSAARDRGGAGWGRWRVWGWQCQLRGE